MTDTTINDDEIAKFSAMADEWWDPKGKFKPLHKFNPVRLGYIRDKAIAHFGKDGTRAPAARGPAHPRHRLRRRAAVRADGAARRDRGRHRCGRAQHPRSPSCTPSSRGSTIDYRATTAEALAAAGEQFDVVLNMEVVEHVDNVPLYMKSCADLVAPGGLMFTATINRTPRAFALAIVGAEYVLRLAAAGAPTTSEQVPDARRDLGADRAQRPEGHRQDRRRLPPARRRMAAEPRHGRQLHGAGGEAGSLDQPTTSVSRP